MSLARRNDSPVKPSDTGGAHGSSILNLPEGAVFGMHCLAAIAATASGELTVLAQRREDLSLLAQPREVPIGGCTAGGEARLQLPYHRFPIIKNGNQRSPSHVDHLHSAVARSVGARCIRPLHRVAETNATAADTDRKGGCDSARKHYDHEASRRAADRLSAKCRPETTAGFVRRLSGRNIAECVTLRGRSEKRLDRKKERPHRGLFAFRIFIPERLYFFAGAAFAGAGGVAGAICGGAACLPLAFISAK